mgnify:CR=1 FL=1
MSTAIQPPKLDLSQFLQSMSDLERVNPVVRTGKVLCVTGPAVESSGPLASIGDICKIQTRGGHSSILAEVVGFRSNKVLLMPFGDMEGVQPGSTVTTEGKPLQIKIGFDLMGRVLNSLGDPIDGMGPIQGDCLTPLKAAPPHPMRRMRISERFQTGVRALDTFIPCGMGQRLGIFAGSGVGKSTLLGMIAGHAEAEVNVIALIGERGRELREFIERDLSEEARAKSILVVATSDEPPIMRLKGAYTAMAIAEHFRDQGMKVMLMMDSVTRFAMAQREVGLSTGELPATKGYPPSVFAELPRLLERAGAGESGSITGLFTVLVEGDDLNDPIADHVRSILDGHIVLSRDLAIRNHYPAIDVLQSVSRLSGDLNQKESQSWIDQARECLAEYHQHKDIITLGAYKSGSNQQIDRAIAIRPALNKFLKQSKEQTCTWKENMETLQRILQTDHKRIIEQTQNTMAS